MKHRIRRRHVAGAIATAALVGTMPASSVNATTTEDDSTRKPPTTKFDPTKIDKGKTRAAYVDGTVLHDGKKTLKLNVPHDVWDVHRLKRGYLVETDDPNSGWGVILYRVAPGGKVTKLRRFARQVWSIKVDSTGSKVAVQIFTVNRGTPLTVFDAYTNKVIRRKNIGKNNVVHYGRGRMLLTRGSETSTLSWYRPGNNKTKRIGKVPGWVQFADPGINLLGARGKGDAPSLVVRRFTQPRKNLWRFTSKEHIPDGIWFSPNGKYAVTSLSTHDQPKLDTVTVRRVSDGAIVRRFKAPLFSTIGWENDRTLIIEAAAHQQAARVRCTIGGTCTRVSRLVEGPSNFYALENLDTLLLDQKLFS